MATPKRKKLLFKTIIGSQAYGTATPGSDVDHKGIYAQHPEEILSFGYVPQYHVSKDEEYFEIRRFLELAQSANPTVIELLWMPEDCVQYCHPAFAHIIKNRDLFLTKRCKYSFGGYAMMQIKKARGLNKKMNWEKAKVKRKSSLDFCYCYNDGKTVSLLQFLKKNNLKEENCGLAKVRNMPNCFNLFYSENPNLKYKGIAAKNTSIKLSSIPKGEKVISLVHYNKDGFAQHSKDYASYQTWLKERNENRYVMNKEHGQAIDSKNMMHCMRLIGEAKEIATEKTINIKRPDAEYLLSIRKGEVNLETLLETAEQGILEINDAFDNCDLPKDVDVEKVNELLKEVRSMLEWS